MELSSIGYYRFYPEQSGISISSYPDVLAKLSAIEHLLHEIQSDMKQIIQMKTQFDALLAAFQSERT